MDLQIISTDSITKFLFVKQRIKTTTNKFDDVFAAVASPANIEDFGELAPNEGSTFFRDCNVSLISSSMEVLNDLFDSIMSELQHLADEVDLLDQLSGDLIYNISANNVETTMAAITTHYRVPLRARPAGTQETYTDSSDGQQKHRISVYNSAVPGWGPGPGNGKYFQYNIAADTAVNSIWPIDAQFLPYAHVEIGGTTSSSVVINSDGIFWTSNSLGTAPFPQTCLHYNDTVLPTDDITLVLDCIK